MKGLEEAIKIDLEDSIKEFSLNEWQIRRQK
jgi:hypothetical protein